MDTGGVVSSSGFKVSGDDNEMFLNDDGNGNCLLYTSPSPRDLRESRMP